MDKPRITFEDRCARIRYEAIFIRSEASHLGVVEGHDGVISLGEVDLAKAIAELASALEAVQSLYVECQAKRDDTA